MEHSHAAGLRNCCTILTAAGREHTTANKLINPIEKPTTSAEGEGEEEEKKGKEREAATYGKSIETKRVENLNLLLALFRLMAIGAIR